jgi:hypothetical protein
MSNKEPVTPKNTTAAPAKTVKRPEESDRQIASAGDESTNNAKRLLAVEKENEHLRKNISPWWPKFVAGLAILIVAALLLLILAHQIVTTPSLSLTQIAGLVVLFLGFAVIVCGFFWYTKDLRSS